MQESYFSTASLDASPCGFVTTTLDGTIIWVNRRFLEWTGCSREDLIEHVRLQDLLVGDGRADLVSAVAKIGGDGAAQEVDSIVAQLQSNDGSNRPVSLSPSATDRSAAGQLLVNVTIVDLSHYDAHEKIHQQTEERLRLLLETAAEGVFCIDTSGRLTLCNAASLRLLGYDDEAEFVGRHLYELLKHSRPDGSHYDETESPIFAAAVRGMSSRIDDECFSCADGPDLPVEYWARPIWRDGVLDGAVCTFVDVTERKQREGAVRDSEQRLRRTIDGMHNFVAVLDAEGKVLDVNQATLDASGVSRADVVNQKFWESYWWSYDEQSAADIRRDVYSALQGRTIRRDVVAQTAGGGRLTVDYMIVPSITDDGQIDQLIVSGVDVTMRRHLERSRNRLAEIVELSVDFVGTADQHGNILFVNRSGLDMVGKDIDQLRGRSITRLHPPAVIDRIKSQGMPTAMREGSWTGETTIIDSKGDEIPVSQTILSHKDDAGKTTHFSTVMRDIRTIKRSEDSRRLLLGEILHRSKNLLAVIQAMAGQTANSSLSTADFVSQLKKRIQGLSASHDLLVKENWRGVLLSELIHGQLRTFLSDTNDPRLVISGPEVILTASATQALGLALHELGTNAVKHGALSVSHGTLSITWRFIRSPDGERRVIIEWNEACGPEVKKPSRSGFGQLVIDDMIAQAMDCRVTIDYAPAGFRWLVDAPETCLVDEAAMADAAVFSAFSSH